jgi:hypothetical protein
MLAKLSAKLKGWRTIIINAVIGGAALLLTVIDSLQGVDIAPLLPPQWTPRVIAGMAVAGVLLRLITTGPVGKKA